MNRSELQMLAQIRIKEARALLNAGLPDGAYYLAGYSVECALKACIAKGTQNHDFPDKGKGMRLGNQLFGDRFIEDSIVYRIR